MGKTGIRIYEYLYPDYIRQDRLLSCWEYTASGSGLNVSCIVFYEGDCETVDFLKQNAAHSEIRNQHVQNEHFENSDIHNHEMEIYYINGKLFSI